MSSDPRSKNERQRLGTCPICKSATSDKYRPFCSKRCADIDLGRWMSGSYVVFDEGADHDEEGAGAVAEEDPEKPS